MRRSIPLFLILTGVCLLSMSIHAQPAANSAPLLIVVNQGDKDISLVDTATEQQIATIPEDVTVMHGHEAAASPDGRIAYVPIYGNVGVGMPGLNGHEMLVIDLPSRIIIGHVDFGHGIRPHCVIYNEHDRLLYVTTELDQDVTLVDPRTLKIVGTIPTGQNESHM
ncbi:MAG: cytochrome D1 domain-containing protein, partial [Acidobacteriaceae bacterium]